MRFSGEGITGLVQNSADIAGPQDACSTCGHFAAYSAETTADGPEVAQPAENAARPIACLG
jgi:hypothetical protein